MQTLHVVEQPKQQNYVIVSMQTLHVVEQPKQQNYVIVSMQTLHVVEQPKQQNYVIVSMQTLHVVEHPSLSPTKYLCPKTKTINGTVLFLTWGMFCLTVLLVDFCVPGVGVLLRC